MICLNNFNSLHGIPGREVKIHLTTIGIFFMIWPSWQNYKIALWRHVKLYGHCFYFKSET